ncbi:MAG: 50S ribosomal protein L11 methyltransferase, partial [Cryobacterium sp.]|nr:50S ribosomal protein L11 methyltransferase [Oligoflexia bacterium]
MSESSFTFTVEVPRQVQWNQARGLRTFEREDFFAYLWETFGAGSDLFTDGEGLVGIHEGTLLAEEAFEAGLETESWMVDSGEAPRERDWIESQVAESAVIYFGREAAAKQARAIIIETGALKCSEVVEQKAEDWDAAWKASFQGVSVPPCWEILPPWREKPENEKSRIIRINPGAGFGTGTHETTQLCLQAIAFAIPDLLRHRNSESPKLEVLDFGSGSGILSIAAAAFGADVDGVE